MNTERPRRQQPPRGTAAAASSSSALAAVGEGAPAAPVNTAPAASRKRGFRDVSDASGQQPALGPGAAAASSAPLIGGPEGDGEEDGDGGVAMSSTAPLIGGPGAAAASAAPLIGDEEEDGDVAVAAPPARAAVGPGAEASPNGAIGLSVRDETIKTLLRFFAKSDFKHDFGEKVPARDWITWEDIKRFTEMVQRFPVKQRTDIINKFTAMFPKPKGNEDAKGDNLLAILQGGIAEQLYPAPKGGPEEFISEEKILEKVGLKYEELKGEIKTHNKNTADPFKKDITIGHSGVFSRNYRVGAQRYKNADGSTRNLASLFKDATGGATKFAVLVDASLGMSVSSFGDATLGPDPGAACNFVILQNVESDADSATGATDFKIKEGGSTAATVKVMRDFDTSTVLYPIWNAGDKRTEAENLFSKIQVILNRVEAGDVEASILLETAAGRETHSIPDVGTTSNVKNASLNGLAAWFANQILGKAATMGDQRKPYIYALLKRMGDWCQALSLLDRIRTYKEMDIKSKKEKAGSKPVTLQDLIAQGFEVGIVTCDRILLAYGLVLGLNVYFTSASDLNCLIYFKNKDDIADEALLTTNATSNYDNFKKLIYGEEPVMSEGPAALKEYIGTKITEAQSIYLGVIPPPPLLDDELDETAQDAYNKFTTDLRATIKRNFSSLVLALSPVLDGIVAAFAVKVILSNLGKLCTNFADIQTQMTANIDVYNLDTSTPKQKYDASVSLVNLASRLEVDVNHNRDVIEQLTSGVFSGNMFTTQRNVFSDLAKKIGDGARMSTSDIMKRAKDVLLSCQNDIKQIRQKKSLITDKQLLRYLPALPEKATPPPPPPSGSIPARPPRPNDKDIDNFTTLYGAFDTLRTEITGVVPAVKKGGQWGGANLELLRAVKQREVFPYTSAKLETTVNQLTAAKDAGGAAAAKQLELLNSLPAVQVGSYYRDEKSRPYSVIDRYLITKEDSKVMEQLFKTFADVKPRSATAQANEDAGMVDARDGAASSSSAAAAIDEEDGAASSSSAAAAAAEADGSQARKVNRLEEGLPVDDTPLDPDLMAGLKFAKDLKDEDRNFIIYRFALLYHDLLYERYERAYDQWNTEGTFSDEVEIEDSEMTEGTQVEFTNIGREAAVLRLFINRLTNKETPYTSSERQYGLGFILGSFQEGVSEETVDFIEQSILTPGERPIFKTFRDAIPNTLARTRDVIFSSYKPQPIGKVYEPPPNLVFGTFEPNEVESQDIETLIDTGERLPPLGGGSLKAGGGTGANADDTRTGSSRRGLYTRLRQRAGEGTPPSV